MVFKPYWILFLLTVYFPFEDFFLKWLPVSDRVYSLCRLGGEASVYLLLGVVVFHKLWSGVPLRRTPIDKPLIIFIFMAFISIFVNNAPLVGGLINVRVLLRFVALFYVVVNLNLSESQVRRLFTVILFVAVIESAFGWLQHFAGISDFWLPRPTVEIAGFKREHTVLSGGIEKGAAIGTFAHSVPMALYLFFSEVLILASLFQPAVLSSGRRFFLFAGALFISSGLLFTYSRAAFLAAIIAFFLISLYQGYKRILLFLTAFMVFFMTLLLATGWGPGSSAKFVRVKDKLVSPIYNLRMSLNSEYLAKAQQSRLWVLKDVGSGILKGGVGGVIIGFSPDELTAKTKIAESSGGTLQKLIAYRAFEDVYWIAMFAYYGIIGVGLFLYILRNLYNCSKWVKAYVPNSLDKKIGLSLMTTITILIPLSFLVQAFEIKAFSFYFWLLAGLMMSRYVQHSPYKKLILF